MNPMRSAAETNGAPVWISAYTRTLQHQIASELTRLYPDATSRARKVVIRKGRENYLCLLNLEEALGQLGGAGGARAGGGGGGGAAAPALRGAAAALPARPPVRRRAGGGAPVSPNVLFSKLR